LATVTQQIVERRGNQEQTLMAIRATLERPLSKQTISDLADIAAQNTVDGFIAQDRLDFDGAVLHWSQVFHVMLPELDSARVVKAAQAFTSALFAESKLKDDNSNPYLRVHDEKWQYVRDELVRMCELLGMPSSYGIETSDSYRYHSVNDHTYVKHVIESHRVLMVHLTGSQRGYQELAGLYFAATGLHDQHSKYAIKKGRELMKFYYNMLFELKHGISTVDD
jgi:hypothetical protein